MSNKIKDILSIQLENDIKNVIDLNSQQETDIKEELDGFILTESLAGHLSDFLDAFCSDMKESGVWLSGFYGSGKSYFAKMLGFLIANPTVVGTSMRERFMPKLAGLRNENLIKNQINSLNKSDYLVVLFDSAKVDYSHGLSFMAMSRFLLTLGLLNNWMGFLEYDMLIEQRYDDFLAVVKSQNSGQEWAQIRHSMTNITKFRQAVIELYGISADDFEEKKKLVEAKINSYDADTLKNDLQRYLEIYPAKRVVFFIDEVSEALNQNHINLLDLEGLSEALSSLGNRVWTVGIAQQAFQDVLNGSGISVQMLNKVEARFKTRIPIAAEEIDTIIRRRLLTKKVEGKQQLEAYYTKNSGMVLDVTNIAGISLQPTKDAETYSDYYPFFEHQFKMLQYFLFGSRNTVTSQIGTRGMLISVFDVLKKESMTEADVFTHVNATQLCNQAEESVTEALRMRYEQAEAHLSAEPFKYVQGKALLQTIHFLDKSGAHATVENIARSYVCRLEQYYDILAEVKQALDILVSHNVLIPTANQYKITSQIEQQIIDDMNGFEVPSYRSMAQVTNNLKQLKLVKVCQSLLQDGMNIPFCVETSIGENIANASERFMKVSIDNPFYPEDYESKVAAIKQETQNDRNKISIIPSNADANTIMDLARDLLQIEYIESKNYSTAEEKAVVNTISATKEAKMTQLDELIRKAYTEGTVVYLYNTYQLDDANYAKEIEQVQRRMFGNIYTQRLSATLNDDMAESIIKKPAAQLYKMFGASEEFRFFDTSGKFIGDNLSVVTAILDKCKSYINGKDLEDTLAGPPTGYTYGTIVCAMAALFRGNKVVIKYNGTEYHSAADTGAEQIFKQQKNFGKASFKAVLKSLSYKERQDIVDILKQDCNYKKNTDDNDLSYNLNDFEIVECISLLSVKMMDKVKAYILFDDEKEKLFKGSVQARSFLAEYSAKVTEANYMATARLFLQNADEYISAVERIEKDLRFIDSEFKVIEEERDFILDVKEELEKTGGDMQLIQEKMDLFREAREKDLVANASKLKQWAQDIKDIYYQLMCHQAGELTKDCLGLDKKAAALKKVLDAYPHAWNEKIYSQISTLEKKLQQFATLHIDLKGWSVKCSNSSMLLRDIAYQQQQLKQDSQDVDIWETAIVTEDPKPKPVPAPTPIPGPTPGPTPTPPMPKPVERKMRSKMPKGSCSVGQYRDWLKQQLAMTNKFGDTDVLNFDE